MANKRYVVWDEKSLVVTPSGNVFTAEEWFELYPMARLDTIDLVLSGGVVNGALCYVYQEMIDRYERMGCDFSACETKQDCLDLIEAYEDEMDKKAAKNDEAISNEELTATSLASIAASLEYQNMLTLEDVDLEEEV